MLARKGGWSAARMSDWKGGKGGQEGGRRDEPAVDRQTHRPAPSLLPCSTTTLALPQQIR